MDESVPRTRRWVGWVVPRRGRRRWAILRVAVVVAAIFVFRYHVLAWLVAGHNLAWKLQRGTERNNVDDVSLLLRLRGPGARMLIRIGEAQALARATQDAMLPVLLDAAHRHPDPKVRAHALTGLGYYWDARILEIATEALDHPDTAVRRAAVLAFRRLGDEQHVPTLREHLASETDPGIQALVRQAIASARPAPGPVEAEPGATVKVAAIQFASELGGTEVNRSRLEAFIRDAARNGAKIVVLPETCIQGYLSFDLETAWQVEGLPVSEGVRGISPEAVAETVPGPSTQALGKLARELAIYLTVPLLERDATSGKYYNTLCLLGPAGELVLHYRKLNPWPYAERGWAAKGDRGIVHADSPYGRLSLLICFDIHTEPPRLKKAGVDILLYPIAWVDRPRSSWFHSELPAIARANNLHIIAANWTVPDKPSWSGYGQSRIISRTGRILAAAKDDLAEEIVYAELPIPARK